MPSVLSAPSSPHGSLRSTSPGSPGSVRKQHANRDFCALWIVRRVEVRQILLQGIVELNLALFVQLHDGSRGCKRLRQRRHVEDRVLGHRLCRCGRSIEPRFAGQLAHAISLVEDDLATMPDRNHSTRQPMRRDRIVDQLGGCCEVRRGSRNWRLCWCGSRYWAAT